MVEALKTTTHKYLRTWLTLRHWNKVHFQLRRLYMPKKEPDLGARYLSIINTGQKPNSLDGVPSLALGCPKGAYWFWTFHRNKSEWQDSFLFEVMPPLPSSQHIVGCVNGHPEGVMKMHMNSTAKTIKETNLTSPKVCLSINESNQRNMMWWQMSTCSSKATK